MRLHKEGTPTILLVIVVGAMALFASWRWLPTYALWAVVLLVLVVLGLVLWFFRVPMRGPEERDTIVIAPCDGKVVVVEEVEETEYFKDRRIQVSIFMSPLNVHINFNPISGTTVYKQYHKGKYLVAWHPKSSTENERCTLVVKHPMLGEVLTRQIAGALARRIVTYPTMGDPVVQGSEYGFIKFGSRVDLFLPLGTEVTVRIGQKVQGAITEIARLRT